MTLPESEEICNNCVNSHGSKLQDLAFAGSTAPIPFSFECDYSGGEYSAESSCTTCTKEKMLCGSRAIQAAEKRFVEEERKRKQRKRNARQAEKRKIRRKREAARKLKRQMREAEELRATARKRLKHDRQVAALYREHFLLCRAHGGWVSLPKSEEQREQQCHQESQQTEQGQLELLAIMMEIIGHHNLIFGDAKWTTSGIVTY
jgi:hypothetical protein